VPAEYSAQAQFPKVHVDETKRMHQAKQRSYHQTIKVIRDHNRRLRTNTNTILDNRMNIALPSLP
jgi:hypothetical protein